VRESDAIWSPKKPSSLKVQIFRLHAPSSHPTDTTSSQHRAIARLGIRTGPQLSPRRQLAISTLHLDSHSPHLEVCLNRFLNSAYPATAIAAMMSGADLDEMGAARTANASWSKVARTLTNSA